MTYVGKKPKVVISVQGDYPMAYRTLLAHMSNEDVSAAVLSASTLLAEKHSAHLVGLHLQPSLEFYASDIAIPVEIARQYAEEQRALAGRIKTRFEQKTASRNLLAEWRSVDCLLESVRNALVEQGNTSDLIVISKTEGENSDSRFRHLPEHVLMASGRPVLVVPVGQPVVSIGERVFAAWDGRRESTRALFGALPLLRRAAQVRLHRVNSPHHDRHRLVGLTEELANTLSRHGVQVEVCHSDAHKNEIADELLGFARDMDADLMVMGCYGHSPLREFMLGGTTRQVLADVHIPLLMSN